MQFSIKRPSRLATLTMASLAVSLFCLIYPIYVIRPFRPQGVTELSIALAVLRFRPWVMAVCILVSVFAAIRSWGGSRLWPRIGAIAAVLAAAGFTVLSRINVYELMFHPMGAPTIISSADATLDKDEKVIAINLNGMSRAYPIRSISYHHIVNDVVGDVPIVATY